MRIIGITGGVGAGKSSILAYLQREYKACVIQADLAAHHLEEPGQACYYKIVEAFGSSILKGDMTIDREKLGRLVFSNELKRKKLNEIVHPMVKAFIAARIKEEEDRGEVSCIVIEGALLIEDHYETICSELWYVHTEEDVRRSRLKRYRGYSDEKIDAMYQSQLPEAVFRECCRIVIDNSRTEEETYRQVDAAMRGGYEGGR